MNWGMWSFVVKVEHLFGESSALPMAVKPTLHENFMQLSAKSKLKAIRQVGTVMPQDQDTKSMFCLK